jgi:hypothetical protein
MAKREIKIQLTPEGLAAVEAALRKVQTEAKNASRSAESGTKAFTTALGGLRRAMGALGVGLSVAGLVAIGKAALDSAKDLDGLREAIGGTVEDLSVLRTAFQRGGLGTAEMQQAMTRLSRTLTELGKGAQGAGDTFAQIGLSAKDFQGKDIVAAFTLVSQRMALLPESAEKANLAFELFGQSGADLIGVLNELGVKGFRQLAEEAAAAGRIVSTETAQAAKLADESLRNLRGAAEGAATEFVAGLAPAVTAAMQTVEQEVAGRGVSSLRAWGREVGRIALTVVRTFQLVFGAIFDVVAGAARQLAGFASIFRALTSGEFREAGRIWQDLGEVGREDFNALKSNIGKNLRAIVAEATREAPEIKLPVAPEVDAEASRKAMARLQAQLAKIRARGGKGNGDADRLAKEQLAAEQRAAQVLFDLEQKLLELRGQGRKAQLRALDAEIAKYREALVEAGQLTDEVAAKLASFREASVLRIDFDAQLAEAEGALANFNRDAEQIRRDQEAGLLTQLEGENRLIELERQRLEQLRATSAELLRAAQLTGNAALIAQAEQFAASVGQIAASYHAATNSAAKFRQGLESGLQDGLTGLAANIDEIHSLEDAFRSLARTVAQALAQIAAELLAKQATLAILRAFGGLGGAGAGATGGPVEGYATGGRVRGKRLNIPGPDKIPAMLQEGEYVVRRRVATNPLIAGFLRDLNSGLISPQQLALGLSPPRGYASGGSVSLVSAQSEAAAADLTRGGATQTNARLEGVLGLEEGLVFKQLNSDAFDDLQLYRLSRNPAKFRSALGL